jgi:hypothetical protein
LQAFQVYSVGMHELDYSLLEISRHKNRRETGTDKRKLLTLAKMELHASTFYKIFIQDISLCVLLPPKY